MRRLHPLLQSGAHCPQSPAEEWKSTQKGDPRNPVAGFPRGRNSRRNGSLEPHGRGEPVGRNLSADGEELAGPVLVGALTNLKEGVQGGNEAVFVDGA